MLYRMLSYTHAPRARQGAHSARVAAMALAAARVHISYTAGAASGQSCAAPWLARAGERARSVRGDSPITGAGPPPPPAGRASPQPPGRSRPVAARRCARSTAGLRAALPPPQGQALSPSWVAGARSARQPTGGTARRRVPWGAGSLRLSPLLPRPYSVGRATVSRLSIGGDYAPCGARAIIGARAPWPLRGPLPGPS